jgi:hypothetical protein
MAGSSERGSLTDFIFTALVDLIIESPLRAMILPRILSMMNSFAARPVKNFEGVLKARTYP